MQALAQNVTVIPARKRVGSNDIDVKEFEMLRQIKSIQR